MERDRKKGVVGGGGGCRQATERNGCVWAWAETPELTNHSLEEHISDISEIPVIVPIWPKFHINILGYILHRHLSLLAVGTITEKVQNMLKCLRNAFSQAVHMNYAPEGSSYVKYFISTDNINEQGTIFKWYWKHKQNKQLPLSVPHSHTWVNILNTDQSDQSLKWELK